MNDNDIKNTTLKEAVVLVDRLCSISTWTSETVGGRIIHIAQINELPGCRTHGDTFFSAIEKLRQIRIKFIKKFIDELPTQGSRQESKQGSKTIEDDEVKFYEDQPVQPSTFTFDDSEDYIQTGHWGPAHSSPVEGDRDVDATQHIEAEMCSKCKEKTHKAVQKHIKLQLEGLDNHIGLAKKQVKHARKYSQLDLHNWQGYLSGLKTAQVIIERDKGYK